jgi:regulatory protein
MMQNSILVAELKPLNKKKTVVIPQEGEPFALYNSELRKFSIAEGRVLSEDIVHTIWEEILFPRAKERAWNLVSASMKTSGEIYKKLREGYYPEDICKRVIKVLEEYGYLNDYEYTAAYFSSRMNRKSIQVIRRELLMKGVPDALIRQALEEMKPDENDAITAWLRKKNMDFVHMDYAQKTKLCAALLRKGYAYEDICSAIRQIQQEQEE